MVYTSAIFNDEHETLEQAQDNKMNLVCRKLMLRPGDEMLDIGCGWGTLAMHAAKNFGAKSTGITISKNQTAFGNDRIARRGSRKPRASSASTTGTSRAASTTASRASRWSSTWASRTSRSTASSSTTCLKDDGIFLLQWVGLRRGGELGVPVIGSAPRTSSGACS